MEIGIESLVFDCMNWCENNILCESIIYILVINECWFYNGIERSDDVCYNDFLGYFYIKVCISKYSWLLLVCIFFIVLEFFCYKFVYIYYD